MGSLDYQGNELELFAHAVNWKSYFRSHVLPYLGKCVLEVGAGLGGTTRLLCDGSADHWLCLEPDPNLAKQLTVSIRHGVLPRCCQVQVGTTSDVAGTGGFDSILYMDVIEHIEDDQAELQRAAKLLNPNGCLIVLSPAHQWLYSPFDKAIGHFRRYSRRTLSVVAPQTLHQERLCYLDSVGLMASLANRLLLRQSMPTLPQIQTWDRYLVSLSRAIDPLLLYSAGKSVLGVWRRVGD